MNRLSKTALLLTALAGTAFGDIFLTSPGVPIDSVNWSGIGPDGTLFANGATATSALGKVITIGLGTQPTLGGLTSVVCAPSPVNCSWSNQPSGYVAGDTLLWMEGLDANSNPVGTGPLTLTLNPVFGLGAYIQSTYAGAFSATLALFDGATLLGTHTYTSDGAGDPLFLGADGSVANITKAVFTVTSCGSFGCDVNDFSADTLQIYGQVATSAVPEPSSTALFATMLALVFAVRKRFKKEVLWAVAIVAVAVCSIPVFAQEPVIDPGQLRVRSAPPQVVSGTHSTTPLTRTSVLAPALPLWQYQVVSPRDGNTYTGSMVGGNPFNRGARSTTINVVLIPLRIVFTGTVRTLDPTSPDVGCLGTGATTNTAFLRTQGSPLFNSIANFTMNGVNLGTATFPDAFQRAEFWTNVSTVAPAYHTLYSVTTTAAQTITMANNAAGSGATFSFSGDCGTNATTVDNPPRYGAVDINFMDAQLNTIITNLGLNANQFPLFVMYRTFLTEGPPGSLSGNCCILGYHSTVSSTPSPANPGQTYGIALYDLGFVFGPTTNDMSVLSHEFMEWTNDPSGVNLVAPWGNIGQVGGCQNNLEVGDPLSGTLAPSITMPNGITYHPQELAFYSWFIGGTSLGAGGKYSANGTFGGVAKNCPPGGTN